MGVEAGKSTEVEKQQLTGQKTPHVRVRQERRGKVSHGRETQTMGLSFQVDRKKLLSWLNTNGDMSWHSGAAAPHWNMAR